MALPIDRDTRSLAKTTLLMSRDALGLDAIRKTSTIPPQIDRYLEHDRP